MLAYLQMIETEEERSKFETLYETYNGLMYHIAQGILKDPLDTEDAVHQAFVTLAENIKNIGDPLSSKTKGYVSVIAECRARDMRRYKKRRPHLSYDDAIKGITIDYTGPVAMASCFARLPVRYRAVLLLKYRYGLSAKEITKVMNITESNAWKLLQRARAKLEDMCKEEGIL